MFGVILASYALHLVSYWTYSYIWSVATVKTYNISKAKDAVAVVVKNQLTIMPACGYLWCDFYADDFYPSPAFSTEEVRQWAFMILLHEIIFYHIHGLLHLPYFYKFHKLHHSWINPIPHITLYASYFENAVLNFFPVIISPIIVGLNPYYLPLWTVTATLSGVISHSLTYEHDIHHQKFVYNYGVIGLCDYLYGTNM